MTEIVRSEDCGNSPKNKYVSDITAALANGETFFILSRVSDDILWQFAGEPNVRGKQEVATLLERIILDPVERLVIHHAITHGKAGAVNGTKTMRSGKKAEFCLIFEFQSAKADLVESITVFEIETSP